jgi:benzoate membrane transport protein
MARRGFRDLLSDWTAPLAIQGALISIVGYASSVAIVIQGLKAMGASPQEIASGLLMLGLAKGIAAIVLSMRSGMPISIAWTTPGVALMAVTPALAGGFSAAVGAFLVVALLIMLTGLWSVLGDLVARIPKSIASAMLAGIIFKLCLAPFLAIGEQPFAALAILGTWLVFMRFKRLWAVPAATLLAVGLIIGTQGQGGGHLLQWPSLSVVTPAFHIDALISLAIPLYIVTMASQNITGLAVLSTFGYRPNVREGLLVTGGLSLLFAPLGAPAINYAAITAALAASPEAEADPSRRYVAAVIAGVGYIALGALAGIVTMLVTTSSPRLIEAVAGLALIGSFAGAMTSALEKETERLPAMATFLTASSGLVLFSVGAAFWGLVVGCAMLAFFQFRKPSA